MMRKKIFLAAFFACTTLVSQAGSLPEWTKNALSTARVQLLSAARTCAHTDSFPRSLWRRHNVEFVRRQLEASTDSFKGTLVAQPAPRREGTLRLCDPMDWTSGFFPGSLWYAFAMTGDARLKAQAIDYTNKMYPVRMARHTHDIGFMMDCSYGNALRFAPNDSVKPVLIQSADNLIRRFDQRIGCIRSWDFGDWNFPVIIDNMMNLKLLFRVSHLTGDRKYRDIAVRHALTTMKHHFRTDYTSYHVVSYNDDGTVERKCTFQGKSDDSAWARGQAWAVYGYEECYRETGDARFLKQAEHIADMIIRRVRTADRIPYWDYDAPAGKDTPRDVSAACITASAFLDLSRLADNGEKYFTYAETILRNLSGDTYLARPGTNEGFVLMHSTGSLPNGSEIDTPINYADYYFMEALYRYAELVH